MSHLFKVSQNKNRKSRVYCKGAKCCDKYMRPIKEIPQGDFIFRFAVSGRYGISLRSTKGITLCESCMSEFLVDVDSEIKAVKETKAYDRNIVRQILK
jgi:hypothetical protein